MSLYLQDPDVTLHLGDALETLRTMPDQSVHMCCTSPPFYGLRDYGVDGQIGLEESPDEWVARLVEVFREVRRVLRDDGTLWVEIGDSYCQGHGGSSTEGNYTMRKASRGQTQEPERRDDGLRCTYCGWLAPTYTALVEHHQTTSGHKPGNEDAKGRPRGQVFREKGGGRNVLPGYKPKDLLGQPWLLAFALRADGWYLRSEIIWARPNPMPESVTDRPTKAHSTVFLLLKMPRYYMDMEAIREPLMASTLERGYTARKFENGRGVKAQANSDRNDDGEPWTVPNGANARSVWQIATEPTPFAHFATWPQALVRRMILAGTSERGVCPECGGPWVRETSCELTNVQATNNASDSPHGLKGDQSKWPRGSLSVKTLGWRASCDHDAAPIPATCLDIFGGSGTTALVARKLGRRAVLIELNPDYCALAADRLSQQSLFSEAL